MRIPLAAALTLFAAMSFGQTPKKTGAAPVPPSAKTTAPAASKAAASKPAAPKATATKKAATTTAAAKKAPAKKTVAKGKTAAKKRTVVRRRTQTQPTPERYAEIQDALIGRGLLPGPSTGKWGADSVAALKQFQTSQKLEPTGKINSLSLIRLGLGPKRSAASQGGGLPPSAPKELTP